MTYFFLLALASIVTCETVIEHVGPFDMRVSAVFFLLSFWPLFLILMFKGRIFPFAQNLYKSTFIALTVSLAFLSGTLLINASAGESPQKIENIKLRTKETSMDGRQEYLYYETLPASQRRIKRL